MFGLCVGFGDIYFICKALEFRTKTKEDNKLDDIELCAQDILIIIGLVVNEIGRFYGGGHHKLYTFVSIVR